MSGLALSSSCSCSQHHYPYPRCALCGHSLEKRQVNMLLTQRGSVLACLHLTCQVLLCPEATTLGRSLSSFHPTIVPLSPRLLLPPRPPVNVLTLRFLPPSLHPQRQRATVANLHRLGVRNALVCCHDGRKIPFKGVDRVLLDAPCSGKPSGIFSQALGKWLGCLAYGRVDWPCLVSTHSSGWCMRQSPLCSSWSIRYGWYCVNLERSRLL